MTMTGTITQYELALLMQNIASTSKVRYEQTEITLI